MNWRAKLLGLWNFWPPLFGAGIRIEKVTPDFREMRVVLKKRWWNGNYVGSAYGGSMFSMTDPFYMVMLLRNLGPGFIVWDKSAAIEYLKPGKTHLYAQFLLTDKDLNNIKLALETQEKMDWHRTIEILDENQMTIARVSKVLYIRKKKKETNYV
ncbi:MAG: DUF4442 domain-containing protein [Proteobacteria bacterium]|jgi:hypothetical protein|nr:DUF4442 domain-containing protein [Pseudomonadota bacterium]